MFKHYGYRADCRAVSAFLFRRGYTGKGKGRVYREGEGEGIPISSFLWGRGGYERVGKDRGG